MSVLPLLSYYFTSPRRHPDWCHRQLFPSTPTRAYHMITVSQGLDFVPFGWRGTLWQRRPRATPLSPRAPLPNGRSYVSKILRLRSENVSRRHLHVAASVITNGWQQSGPVASSHCAVQLLAGDASSLEHFSAALKCDLPCTTMDSIKRLSRRPRLLQATPARRIP